MSDLIIIYVGMMGTDNARLNNAKRIWIGGITACLFWMMTCIASHLVRFLIGLFSACQLQLSNGNLFGVGGYGLFMAGMALLGPLVCKFVCEINQIRRSANKWI